MKAEDGDDDVDSLHVLMVEDSETDALLIERELRRGGYLPVCRRVATAAAMRLELERERWDVIICDYNLPGFGALEALELVHSRGLDLPFIIVSGTIGEDTAVAIMKAGAHDYLMKDNLPRLAPAIARDIREAGVRRERRRAEEQLRENEAKFRLLFEDSPISLWEQDFSELKVFLENLRRSGVTDVDGHLQEHPEAVSACAQMVKVLSVNKATLKMFKAREQGELLANLGQIFTPDSLRAFRHELAALSHGATNFAIESEARTLAGEIFFLSRRLQVAPGYEESLGKVVVSVIDITERKLAQEALQKALAKAEDARDKIDAMLKSVASGLLVIDMEGGIILMNRAAERTLGVTLQDSFGRSIGEVLRQESLIDHLGRFLAGSATEEISEQEMFDRGIDEMRTIQTRSSMVQSRDGTRTGVVVTFIDVTRERDIDRMKSEFIKTAAHELRTPLTTIMGYTDLLLVDGRFDREQQREFLTYISEKSETLKRIVDDLFSLSLIEYGSAIVLRRAHCHLNDNIRRHVDRCRGEYRLHRFRDILPEEPICLDMDCERVGQVLENLLSNAVKFSPEGGAITISAEIEGEKCIVRVQDEGKGMTPAQQEKAFEKFYRADATDTAVGGLGLGLTVSKSIVEAHGGKIWIDSAPGEGTMVTFSLPINPCGAPGNDATSG